MLGNDTGIKTYGGAEEWVGEVDVYVYYILRYLSKNCCAVF